MSNRLLPVAAVWATPLGRRVRAVRARQTHRSRRSRRAVRGRARGSGSFFSSPGRNRVFSRSSTRPAAKCVVAAPPRLSGRLRRIARADRAVPLVSSATGIERILADRAFPWGARGARAAQHSRRRSRSSGSSAGRHECACRRDPTRRVEGTLKSTRTSARLPRIFGLLEIRDRAPFASPTYAVPGPSLALPFVRRACDDVGRDADDDADTAMAA